eukprot:2648949-Pyramimonas_sp.AAC.1
MQGWPVGGQKLSADTGGVDPLEPLLVQTDGNRRGGGAGDAGGGRRAGAQRSKTDRYLCPCVGGDERGE